MKPFPERMEGLIRKKEFPHLILILSILTSFPTSIQTASTPEKHPNSPEHKAIPGLHSDEIPLRSTFYESVAPLVYQLSIPKWNTSDLTIPPSGSNCSSPEFTTSSTCPVEYYWPEAQSRFIEYLLSSQPLANTFESINARPQASTIIFECGILAKHFQDLYVDSKIVESYLSKLKKCSPIGGMDFFRKIPNYNYNIPQVYLKMREGFYKEFWAKIHDGRTDAALWSNALNILNSLNYLNYYIEANRWKFALVDCQNGRIPSTILPPDFLTDTISDLAERVKEEGLEPVISTEDVGNYYKANNIADCTFTNNTLLVRVLIPVVSQHRSHSLLKLASAKFWYKNEQICEMELPQSEYILMDHMDQIAYETDCKPNELCHVPSVKSQGRINVCASAYVNGHFWDLKKFCKLKCQPLSQYHLNRGRSSMDYEGSIFKHEDPIFIQRSGSAKFLVTGVFVTNSSLEYKNPPIVKCPDGKRNIDVKIVSLGAVEVILPCRCRLIYRNVTFEPKSPCEGFTNSVPKIFQVIPFHWLKDENLEELKPKTDRGGPLVLKYEDHDIIFRGLVSPNVMVSGETSNPENSQLSSDSTSSSSSSGTTFILVVYLLLIVILFVMVLFLTFRLKSMGVNVNPFPSRGTQEISYSNVQGESTGGCGLLLERDSNHY